jgi:hypothetical protein
MTGKIIFIRPTVKNGRLRVRVTVQTARAGNCQARLPDRELAALVPRSLLVFDTAEAPLSLLGIISSLLKRTTVGRRVRLHRGEDGGLLVAFLSWRSVRFLKPGPDTPVSGMRPLPNEKTTTA